MLIAALVFTMLNASRIGTARVGLSAVLSAAVLLYAASGHLITSRRPDNAIGWLLGVYAGLVLLATQVIKITSPVAVAAPRWPPRPCSARSAPESSTG